MKRILNLHEIGFRLLAVAALFGLGIPGLLWGLRAAGILVDQLPRWMRLSMWVGIGLLVVLFVLIVVEQVQDSFLYQRYLKERQAKLALADGQFECQYCGFRQVRAADTSCPVCGRDFSDKNGSV
jgi:hypothetical protein